MTTSSPPPSFPLSASHLIGRRTVITMTVFHEHTAAHVGSGLIRVLATPVLVNWLEAAALQAVERFIPEGYQTVGTLLSLRHTAATPVGMQVEAIAEVIGVQDKTIRFRLHARDSRETIAEGEHERVAVSLARFDQRMKNKQSQYDL